MKSLSIKSQMKRVNEYKIHRVEKLQPEYNNQDFYVGLTSKTYIIILIVIKIVLEYLHNNIHCPHEDIIFSE